MTLDEALKKSDSANNLRLIIKLHSNDNGLEEVPGTSTPSDDDEQSPSSSGDGLSLSLEEKDENEKSPRFYQARAHIMAKAIERTRPPLETVEFGFVPPR